MTPFHRLALLACATVYALGLALVWRYLGWPTAAAVAAGGIATAVLVTLELTPRTVAVPVTPDEEARDDWAIRARDRRDIERSARQARAE